MAIEFPNPSRSYDAKSRCVRFWGHDDASEVSFLIEEEALRNFDEATGGEDGLLTSFDDNRSQYPFAARKAYSRRGSGFYRLAASDF